MATNTTPLGFRYPDGNETPALDVLLGNLAGDVDTYLNTAWETWAPVLNAGWTQGNGTLNGFRKFVGKTCDFRLEFTWGSTSAFGTGPGFTLPASRKAVNVPSVIGDIVFYDTSVPTRKFGIASVLPSTSNTCVIYVNDGTTPTAANPFTLAAGDFIVVTGRFERA